MDEVIKLIFAEAVNPVFRGYRYMFRYRGLINELKFEMERMYMHKVRMSDIALEERDKGKTINGDVLKWQKEVEEIQKSAKEFLSKYKDRHSWKCTRYMPIPKPVSRFRQGRKAVRMAKRVADLVELGREFIKSDEIAYLPPVENILKKNTGFQFFKSREDAYEELWGALLSQNGSSILGIYGIAGVGKTRMVEQVEEEAIEKRVFATVARADVGSGKLDVIQLQDQIAEYFDCHFESQDDVDDRAHQLKYSIKYSKIKRGKILIILDDVWSAIPLDVIGIPLGNDPSFGTCKILLTSQEEDVCLQNNCKRPVHITPLTIDEGWDLFRKIVGTYQIDSLQDESIAKEVCNQCEGLPLLIHVVGKALESVSHSDWEDTLYQLKNCRVESISETGSEELDACLKLCTINSP